MPPTSAILSSSSSHSSLPQGHVLRALLAKHPQMYTVTFYSTQASNSEIKTPQKQKGLLVVGFRKGKTSTDSINISYKTPNPRILEQFLSLGYLLKPIKRFKVKTVPTKQSQLAIILL